METRKKLFKAGIKLEDTLTARKRAAESRRKTARFDKFAAGRDNSQEDSPEALPRHGTRAHSKSRLQKLKDFRLAKNTEKLQEIQQKRSPFITAVPSGRWVEKKERTKFKFELNDTPVRTVLMTERVLKTSTVKNIIAHSAAKKENIMIFGKNENVGQKKPKKILGELNAQASQEGKGPARKTALKRLEIAFTESNSIKSLEEPTVDPINSLNDTFEILQDLDGPNASNEAQHLRRSTSLPEIVTKKTPKEPKALTPPSKPVSKKQAVPKPAKAATNSGSSKTVIVKPVTVKPSKQRSNPNQNFKAAKKPVLSRQVPLPEALQEIIHAEETLELGSFKPVPEVVIPVKAKNPSHIYTMYKSSIDVQIAYFKLQVNEIYSNQESHKELLTEEKQTFMHATLQQVTLLVTDKFKKFSDVLDQHEDHPTRVTDGDVENYWHLLYDEMEKLKADLTEVQLMRQKSLKALASQLKRRTRRTYIPDDGTPRKSDRIAKNADTPKHNTSCYGCVTLSASKINTPKSARSARRTTQVARKSILPELDAETPKVGRPTGTSRRTLARMNAFDKEETQEIQELM